MCSAMPNTVTFTSRDGTERSFPLDYLLEHDAILVDTINGEPLAQTLGARNQLWIAGTAAKYFLRDVVSIRFSDEEVPPEPPALVPSEDHFVNRPNVAARGSGRVGVVGEPLEFEGWADDYDKRIVAVEFSLDGGKTWTSYDTSSSKAGVWVYWRFSYTPTVAGSYQLCVRSVNEDGAASPVAALYRFSVVEGA